MIHLVRDLLEKLERRKKTEMARIQKHKDDREILLVSSGKVLEIENFIKDLEEMLIYYNKTHV